MEIFKIKIHSVVNLITNSSTTIYTYQDGCVKYAYELLESILEMIGIDKDVAKKDVKEIFNITSIPDETDYIIDAIINEIKDCNPNLSYSDDIEINDFISIIKECFDEIPIEYIGIIESIYNKTNNNNISLNVLVNELIIESMILYSSGNIETYFGKEFEDIENGNGYRRPTSLNIFVKDEKYKDIANKIIGIVNAVSADGGYDG